MVILAWPAESEGNPYVGLLYRAILSADARFEVRPFSVRQLLTGRVDVWHVHWPERPLARSHVAIACLAAGAFLALIAVAKLRRVRIVWTVHNLRPHRASSPRLTQFVLRSFAASVDGVVALSRRGHVLACETFPAIRKRPFVITPHGTYPVPARDPEASARVRRAHGLPQGAEVVGLVGRLGPQKDPLGLVDAFERLQRPSARLLLCGAGEPPLIASLRKRAEANERIVVSETVLSDDQMAAYIRAVDVLALPYGEGILNSGSAILALSLGTPILAPNVGALPELAASVPARWVTLYRGELAPFDVDRALLAARRLRSDAGASTELRRALDESFNWTIVGRATSSFLWRVGTEAA